MQLSDRIGRRMKLHDLHVLMAVVQAGSMNKAAVALHTTQPAISRSIGELERTVGVRLLDRNPRGVAPTSTVAPSPTRRSGDVRDLRQAKTIEFPTPLPERYGSDAILSHRTSFPPSSSGFSAIRASCFMS
jgi:hypothetical protein